MRPSSLLAQVFVAMIALSLNAEATTPQSDDAAVFGAAKQAVLEHLKDPGSAKFGPMTRAQRPNVRGELTDVVCGKVNAKNAFGGYPGMTGFVYFVESKSVNFADGSDGLGDLGATIYHRFCDAAP